MHFLMRVLSYHRITKVASVTDIFAVIYYFLNVCLYLFAAYRCVSFIIRRWAPVFELKFVLQMIHQLFYLSSPLINLIYFGFFARVSFSVYHRELLDEMRTNNALDSTTDKDKIRANCRKICMDMFIYANVIGVLGYSVALMHAVGVASWYEYIPLPLIEIWDLTPSLYYLYLVVQFVTLNDVIIDELVRRRLRKLFIWVEKNPQKANVRSLRSLRNIQLSSRRRLVKLFELYKKILHICYEVLPSEHGCMYILLMMTYSLSLMHDCLFVPKMPTKVMIIASLRTAHKLIFFVVFFGVGENAKLMVSHATTNC